MHRNRSTIDALECVQCQGQNRTLYGTMSIYFAVLSSEIGTVTWLQAGRSQDRCQSARRDKFFFLLLKRQSPSGAHPASCLLFTFIYRVSQEERTKLRESVPYVELYRYNPKHLYPKLNGDGDNCHRKVWASGVSTYCTPSVTPYSYSAHARQPDTASRHRNAVTLAR